MGGTIFHFITAIEMLYKDEKSYVGFTLGIKFDNDATFIRYLYVFEYIA